MKGRFDVSDKILDAGCGNGRNMHWFLQHSFEIYGIDMNEENINILKNKNPNLSEERLQISELEKMNFPANFFDHVICSAVLHFAKNTSHFKQMLTEMLRVLKSDGTLFIRMTSDIGIENTVRQIADGIYWIPDGSKRFLLTKNLLAECMRENNLSFTEPLKTVNVNDERCMTTLVLRKNS